MLELPPHPRYAEDHGHLSKTPAPRDPRVSPSCYSLNILKNRKPCDNNSLNFKPRPYRKYEKEVWWCSRCGSTVETEDHVPYCAVYAGLTEQLSRGETEDVMRVFMMVSHVREKMKNKE